MDRNKCSSSSSRLPQILLLLLFWERQLQRLGYVYYMRVFLPTLSLSVLFPLPLFQVQQLSQYFWLYRFLEPTEIAICCSRWSRTPPGGARCIIFLLTVGLRTKLLLLLRLLRSHQLTNGGLLFLSSSIFFSRSNFLFTQWTSKVTPAAASPSSSLTPELFSSLREVLLVAQ